MIERTLNEVMFTERKAFLRIEWPYFYTLPRDEMLHYDYNKNDNFYDANM